MNSLHVNGAERTVDIDPGTPILWALRDTLGLTGTKFGCGMALCGACTVHVDGVPVRSCVTPVGAINGAVGGDKLFLFDEKSGDKILWSTPLPSAHGLVWDAGRQRRSPRDWGWLALALGVWVLVGALAIGQGTGGKLMSNAKVAAVAGVAVPAGATSI